MIGYAAITDTGVCPKNDDRIMVNGEVISSGSIGGTVEAAILAVVCDGVGGHLHGDEAAEITAKVFAELTNEPLTQEKIELAITDANNKVLAQREIDPAHRNMASTIAGIYIDGGDFIAFNVGDTKIYRYRNSYLSQMSVDHTFTQESLDIGLVENKDEIHEQDRHKITRCIGEKNRCQPNVIVGSNRVFTGDIYLVCSDGLSDVVGVDEMEKNLSEPIELSERCKHLFQSALKNGSQDNISIILLEVV